MEISVSILTEKSRIPEIKALFGTSFGETTDEYWEWRLFADNGADSPLFVIAQTEDGRIVGMSNSIPAFYGNGSKCVQLGDWVVHPDFRGNGIIGRIYRFFVEYYSEKGYDFIIEFPNDNSYPIFKKYNFDEEKSFDFTSSKRFYLPAFEKYRASFNGYSLEITDNIPHNIEFVQRPDKMLRNEKLMKWKYDDNPAEKFKWLTVYKGGSFQGYFVFAQNHGRINTAVNIYDFDFLPDDGELFGCAIKLLKSFGNYVSLWGRFDERAEKLLSQAKMKRSESSTRVALKALSEKGYPEKLTITRIDADY